MPDLRYTLILFLVDFLPFEHLGALGGLDLVTSTA